MSNAAEQVEGTFVPENLTLPIEVYDEFINQPSETSVTQKLDDKTTPGFSMSRLYPQYYKDVRRYSEIDVYATHQIFNLNDPSGALQHASKKILLSGVRTGGKSKFKDIREARDTLNRWLELNSHLQHTK